MAQPAINAQLQALLDGISDSKAKTAISNLLNTTADLAVMYNILVTPAQQLMMIVPHDTQIEVEAGIENKDTGPGGLATAVSLPVGIFHLNAPTMLAVP